MCTNERWRKQNNIQQNQKKNYTQVSASGLGDKIRNQLAEILDLVCLLFQLIALQGKNLSQSLLHLPDIITSH